MKRDLDHLPPAKQRELERALAILFAEFDDAVKLATSADKKAGRILKVILFGSYARGGWVDEPHTAKGYLSDYDLLVVVNHDRLTDFATYWYAAEDRLMHAPGIKTPVNFIVHTLGEVNDALAKGQYFFSDIVKEGIALHEMKGAKGFVEAKPPTTEEEATAAKKHFKHWMESAAEFFDDFERNLELQRTNKAAFELHQAVERLYTALLLVLTNYSPSTHNIKALRSLAEQQDQRLIEAWPRETRQHRRTFELLKRAYVEARYSEHYAITPEELAWLGERATALKNHVATIATERIDALAH